MKCTPAITRMPKLLTKTIEVIELNFQNTTTVVLESIKVHSSILDLRILTYDQGRSQKLFVEGAHFDKF